MSSGWAGIAGQIQRAMGTPPPDAPDDFGESKKKDKLERFVGDPKDAGQITHVGADHPERSTAAAPAEAVLERPDTRDTYAVTPERQPKPDPGDLKPDAQLQRAPTDPRVKTAATSPDYGPKTQAALQRMTAPSDTVQAGPQLGKDSQQLTRIDPTTFQPKDSGRSGRAIMQRQQVVQDVMNDLDPNQRQLARSLDPELAAVLPGEQAIALKRTQEQGAPAGKRGLLGRLAEAGRGALYGLETGRGVIPGAITGAADPDELEKQIYQSRTLPRAQKAAATEEAQQQGVLARAREVSGETGIDPLTGQETVSGAYRKYLAQLGTVRADQRQQQLDINKSKAQDYHERLKGLDAAAQKRNIALLYKEHAFDGDPDSLSWAAEQLGIPGELRPQFYAGQYKTFVGADGTLNIADLKSGKVTSTGAGTIQGATAAETKRHHGVMESRVSPAQAKQQAEAALIDQWTKAGKTPGGEPIVNGTVADPKYKLSKEEQAEVDRIAKGSPSRGIAADPQAAAAREQQIRSGHRISIKDHPEFKTAAASATAAATAQSGAQAKTMTQAQYALQVKKHGQEATDKWLSDNGYTVK